MTVSHAAPGQPVDELPPPINVECPAGTIMLFDHRILVSTCPLASLLGFPRRGVFSSADVQHGTGVNRTPNPRHILIAGFHRTWMRTQEAWLLSAAPEVVRRASPRLLQRLGFSAHTIGTIEGHGLGASGAADDEFSSVVGFRHAVDSGEYRRIGVLSPETASEEQLLAPFTFRTSASGKRALGKAQKFGLLPEDRLAAALELSGGSEYAKRGTGNNELGLDSAHAGARRAKL